MEITLDLNAICLTCMCISERTLSVHTKDLKYGLTLMTMITKISLIEVENHYGMPDKLCYTCAELLRSAYGFQQTCISSYNTLCNYVKLNLVIPSETNHESLEDKFDNTDEQDEIDANIGKNEKSPENLDEKNYTRGEQAVLERKLFECHNQSIESISMEENNKDLTYNSKEYLEEALVETVKMEYVLSEEVDTTIDNASQEYIIEKLNESSDDALEDEVYQSGETNDEKKKKPQCPVCDRVLSKHSHLKRHMLSHSQEKPFQCSVCSKSFSRSDNLSKHMSKHSSARPFPCVVCGKSFKRDEHLKVHLVRQHESSGQVDESLVCSICKRVFAFKENLERHITVTHTNEKDFVCSHCGKQFTNRAQFVYHCRTHGEEPPKSFLCAYCGKSFNRKDYWIVHIRRHTGENPFKCNYCDKAFPRMADLKVHEMYHTNKKNYHCTTCGKTFFRRCSLKIHMRIHTGEKPHQCPHCPKQFIQSYDLKIHIRRHTGERFQCNMCEEKFLHAYQLSQHAKAIHNGTLVHCDQQPII